MGSGTSSAHLTREECKQLVPEDKWDDSWDEFYFDSDLKTVSREIAERVWAKSERWEAYVATGHAPAEPKDGGVEERDGSKAEDAPLDRVANARAEETALAAAHDAGAAQRRGPLALARRVERDLPRVAGHLHLRLALAPQLALDRPGGGAGGPGEPEQGGEPERGGERGGAGRARHGDSTSTRARRLSLRRFLRRPRSRSVRPRRRRDRGGVTRGNGAGGRCHVHGTAAVCHRLHEHAVP